MKTGYLAAAFLFCALLAGCDGGNSGTQPSLSPEDQRELERRISEAEAELGFEVVVPGYLPPGLNGLPVVDVDSDHGTVLLFFPPDTADTQSPPDGILVFQSAASKELQCATLSFVPVDPRYSCEDIVVEGRPAVSEIDPLGEREVDHSVSTVSDGKLIQVSITWPIPESGPLLSKANREQTLAVLASMLE